MLLRSLLLLLLCAGHCYGARVSFFPDDLVPQVTLDAISAYEFGIHFKSNVAGTIEAIKFYKSNDVGGEWKVTLWAGDKTSLATATADLTTDSRVGW